MQRHKMGGKSPLRIFLKGNDDLTYSLLPPNNGSQNGDGLKNLVHDKFNGRFEVDLIHEPCGSSGLLETPLPRRLYEEPVDVMVFSLQPEITRSQSSVERFKSEFLKLVRMIKERLDAHVIVFNCSTLDPADLNHNYYNLEETLSLCVQKFNLALLQISTLEGISIIDVDRLIAQLGGERHVTKALSYSRETYQATCQEFLRVLEDIGFFENRPLLMQVGQKGATR